MLSFITIWMTVSAESEREVEMVTNHVWTAIADAGLQVAEEKVQSSSPWKYSGWQIMQQEIRPQPICINTKNMQLLNDFQKLLGTINWLCSILGTNHRRFTPSLFITERGSRPQFTAYPYHCWCLSTWQGGSSYWESTKLTKTFRQTNMISFNS